MDTLAKLDPATLAPHASTVVALLDDPVWELRQSAVIALGKLDPATLAQHASAVVTLFNDEKPRVRRSALLTLAQLAPAAIAQHADSVVAKLGDYYDWRDKDSVPAFEALCKLEPAALAQHALPVIAMLEDIHHPAVRKAAFKTLRGLPRYVTHNIHLSFFYNYDENLLVPGMDYSGVCCGLRGRLSWYKCRLGLRVKRLALYWYALPYRPSGPGHAREVAAWEQMIGEPHSNSS